MLLRGGRRQAFNGCRNRRWHRGLILCSLGLEGVHLRDQVADVSTRRLMVVTCLSPLIGKLMLCTMKFSTDSARGLAKGVARRKGGKLVIGV